MGKIISILLLGLIISFEAHSNVEISAHARAMGPGSGGYHLIGARFRVNQFELTVQRFYTSFQGGLAYQIHFFEKNLTSLHLNFGVLLPPLSLYPGIGFKFGKIIGIRIDEYVQVNLLGSSPLTIRPMTILGAYIQL